MKVVPVNKPDSAWEDLVIFAQERETSNEYHLFKNCDQEAVGLGAARYYCPDLVSFILEYQFLSSRG